MPLVSSIERHKHYLENPHVLMDTCALTWFARHSDGPALLADLLKQYALVIPATVLYELAFGAEDQASSSETELRKSLFKIEYAVDMIHYAFMQQRKEIRAGRIYIVSPGFNEWWTARDRLLTYARMSKAQTRNVKKQLSMDALIHACARNCFAPICTVNVDDFKKLNLASGSQSYDLPVPYVTPEAMIASLTSDVRTAE